MEPIQDPLRADDLSRRIQNRAAGRIESLLAQAQGEVEPQALWNSLWAAGVSEDASVPVVEPSDLKNILKLARDAQESGTSAGAIGHSVFESVCSPGANVTAVWYRAMILGLCANQGLLDSWLRSGELDNVVFEVAATFPMKRMEFGVEYKGLPLDVEGFLRQIERASGVK